jgi:hypothetical protein
MSDTERSSSARAIRELSSARRARRSKSPTPPPSHPSDGTLSTINSAKFDDEALMSTRNFDEEHSHMLPQLRATAQKMAYYSPPQPQQHVPTSVVNRNFHDFDSNNDTFNNGALDDSESIEVGRGLGHTPSRANRSTPRVNSDMTPPVRPKPTPKSSLRRDAALRRASGNRSGLANASATDKPRPRPEEMTRDAKHSRFGRNFSGSDTENFATQGFGTPRSAANGTAQSFMLPDLPNLTELVSGTYKDGTPIFSKSGKKRSRFSSAPCVPFNQPNFIPVGAIGVPEDEKAILASLQLLKDKFAQLEQEKLEADRRIEEYEDEAVKMRAQLVARQNFRRSDSALGSTDGEGDGSARTKWQIEKTRKDVQL